MLQEIDFYILDTFYNFFKCEALDSIFPIITSLGNRGAIWIIIAIICLFFKKLRKTGVCVLLSLLLSYIVGNILLKNIFARVRPYDIIGGIDLLINPPSDFSFPSGHTLSSMSAATAIFINNKKIGRISILLSILIALSRLYLYVHFPSDILAGVIIGILIGIFSNFLIRKSKILVNI